MRSPGFAILITALFLALLSCSQPGLERLPEGQFHAQRIDTGGWYIVETDPDLYREGLRCRVYVQAGLPSPPDAATVDAIVTEFDSNVFPAVRSWFGEPSDVDVDGRITILIMDIIDGADPGGEYVAGYFHAVNEFAASVLFPYRYSNERDMLYMDCNPGNPAATTFNLTMAHELQHLVNFNQKVFVQGSPAGQDTWINEGLSNAAEYVYQQAHVADKIDYYNLDHYAAIAAGQSFLSWSGEYENYVTAYLFFQWLRIHSADGQGVYKRILDNPGNTCAAVVEETRADIADKVPDRTAQESDWERTLRSWYVANLFYNPLGLYGYKKDLPADLIAHVYDGSSGKPISLNPGEAVFLDITADADLEAVGSIAYAGLTEPAGVDLESAYSGDFLVAYNRNGDENGAAEAADPSLSVAAAASLPRTRPQGSIGDRAVDAVMGVGRTRSMVPRSLRR